MLRHSTNRRRRHWANSLRRAADNQHPLPLGKHNTTPEMNGSSSPARLATRRPRGLRTDLIIKRGLSMKIAIILAGCLIAATQAHAADNGQVLREDVYIGDLRQDTPAGLAAL